MSNSDSGGVVKRRSGGNRVKFADNVEYFEIQRDEYVDNEHDHPVKPPTGPFSVANICWLLAAVAVTYYSNILNVIFYNPNIYRGLAYVSLSLILSNVMIGLYLIIWVTHVKKISVDCWNDFCPSLIPIATAAFVIGFVTLMISIWPVYSWLSGPILFIILMGFITVIVNLPSWI